MRKIKIVTASCIGLFYFNVFLFSQNTVTPTSTHKMDTPQLEFVCELIVTVGKPQQVGETGMGTRKIIPILGGTFKGPKMQGIIIPGGADWQLINKDGIAEIDARYTLQTDDSTLIYVSNKGIRVASEDVLKKLSNGEQVSLDEYYFSCWKTYIGRFNARCNSRRSNSKNDC